MDYIGLADLTLMFKSHSGEKSAACSGITVQLFFTEPQRQWTVLFHDPNDLVPLDGLTRAVVSLADGRRLAGAAKRTPSMGGGFTLIED